MKILILSDSHGHHDLVVQGDRAGSTDRYADPRRRCRRRSGPDPGIRQTMKSVLSREIWTGWTSWRMNSALLRRPSCHLSLARPPSGSTEVPGGWWSAGIGRGYCNIRTHPYSRLRDGERGHGDQSGQCRQAPPGGLKEHAVLTIGDDGNFGCRSSTCPGGPF